MKARVRHPQATGQVTFYDGDIVLGVVSIIGGRAVLVRPLPGTGEHFLRAHYSGDSGHPPSDSAIVTLSAGRHNTGSSWNAHEASGAPPSYLISTTAGGKMLATVMPAASAVMGQVAGVATDVAGNVYVSSIQLRAVFRLDPSGMVTRVAGNGGQGSAGDSLPAVSAAFVQPSGVAVDLAGNLYISDQLAGVVRKVDTGGIITTVAGGGGIGYGGDTGPATAALLNFPSGVAVDSSGNLYIADVNNSRVRKVDTHGIITTVAGNGTSGYSGDSGAATNAELNGPAGVAVNGGGELLIADTQNARIRKVTTGGIISTVAGTGVQGYSGSNGLAASAQLLYPEAVTSDSFGNLYIGDETSLRKVTTNGEITTIAGTGAFEYLGDVGPATTFPVGPVGSVAVDPSGNLFMVDYVRVQEISNGILTNVFAQSPADGSLASLSQVGAQVVARDTSGNLYFIDGNLVRRVDTMGVVITVAGTGKDGYAGDGGPATMAQLSYPTGLAVDSFGNLYIADSGSRVRKVSRDGTISTFAGTLSPDFSGDGGPAIEAQLWLPLGLACDSAGNLYIADDQNQRVRKVTRAGIISTVAGNGTAGFSGDGSLAINAELHGPTSVAIDGQGNLYVADIANQRIREIGVNGIIATFAGGGAPGNLGDGGPATSAQLDEPYGVTVDGSGNVFIAENAANRFRMVASGIITTIAGNGGFGYYGDNGPATSAGFEYPAAIVADQLGNLIVTDDLSHTIRLLTPVGTSAVLAVSSSHTGNFFLGGTGQYNVTVSNAPQAGATSGTVNVTDIVPTAFPAYSISGTGWTCGDTSCSRSDSLSGGSSYPDIIVTINVPESAPLQVTNQVTVSGGGAAITGGSDFTVITPPPPTTIWTNPSGLQIAIDGLAAQTTPQSVNLFAGSHTISVASPQAGLPGTQYVFTGWSDFGAASHTIDVTGTPTTYTATFKTQYQLTTAAFPQPGGAVTPSTGAFYDVGTVVPVNETANLPYVFTSWSGASSASSNSISITMSTPQSITAGFAVPGFTCAITGDTTASVADVQLIVNEALGIAAPNHDLNGDHVVNIADVQKVIAAATGVGCLY
jgi:uncharacterized repeat protein (TIGR01451 family)